MSFMIREKEVKAKEEIVDKYSCDLCGNIIICCKEHKPIHCWVCRRDMCSNCRTIIKWDDSYSSDYPTRICNICFKYHYEFGEKYRELDDKHEKRRDTMYEEWKLKSLSNVEKETHEKS